MDLSVLPGLPCGIAGSLLGLGAPFRDWALPFGIVLMCVRDVFGCLERDD